MVAKRGVQPKKKVQAERGLIEKGLLGGGSEKKSNALFESYEGLGSAADPFKISIRPGMSRELLSPRLKQKNVLGTERREDRRGGITDVVERQLIKEKRKKQKEGGGRQAASLWG